MTGHIHAENMRLYAEDAAKTEEPWKLWQSSESGDMPWKDMNCHPKWYFGIKYRRKPVTKKMIRICGRWVPEPMREAPREGTKYYVVYAKAIENPKWTDTYWDKTVLSAGICHLTREAAQQHLDALIALNNQEAQDVECE